MKIGINGFGRIGRAVLRILSSEPGFRVTSINTPGLTSNCIHLLKYDSIHGRFDIPIFLGEKEDEILVGNNTISFSHERNIDNIDWSGVDLVLECSGVFNSHDKSSAHLRSGARRVLISAPVADADKTIVYGVNHSVLSEHDRIISVGSCTTNCLAPMLDVLESNFGIESTFMTTIHAYTNDQNVVDNNHKDLRRARACALSMIPTTTGAARTIGKILPKLDGKVDGVAIRVPTPNVSLVDLSAVLSLKVDADAINKAFVSAENGYLKGVLSTCTEPLVSIDFNKDSHSCIVDLTGTHSVSDGEMVRIAAWYDNEWGFASRMVDLVKLIHGMGW